MTKLRSKRGGEWMRLRSTMGHDSSAYRKLNPEGCRRVHSDEVKAIAILYGIRIKRDGQMWLYKSLDTWYTLGMTNYLALEQLKKQGNKHEPNVR